MDQEEREALELTKEDLLAKLAEGRPVKLARVPRVTTRSLRLVKTSSSEVHAYLKIQNVSDAEGEPDPPLGVAAV